MNADPETFTAAEIAYAIGWSKRRTTAALDGVPAIGSKAAAGQLANAWSIAVFPPAIAEQLERIRRVHRYRSAEDVLHNPLTAWEPVIPLAQVAPRDLRKAERLQSALTRALALPDGESIAERARVAAEDFTRVAGYAMSNRQLRVLITRTIDRDRGQGRFERSALYLGDDARPAGVQPPTRHADFPELSDAFVLISNQADPTPADVSFCWRKIVECYQEHAAAGAGASTLKRELCAFVLRSAAFLAPTAEALKRNLNRKLQMAEADGVAALIDRRREKSGNRRRPDDWQENITLFARITRLRHGCYSQAWRELMLGKTPNGERFSEGFRSYYPFNVRRAKSQVPPRARAAIRPMIEATNDIALGPKQARVRMPSHHRDWSDTAAGAIHTADDFTPDQYWFEEVEDGEFECDGARFNVGRGQVILFVDERTDFPLYFDLSLNAQPNSRMVFSACGRIWRDEGIGLPDVGANFEKNLFESHKVKALFAWPTLDESFAREGIKLRLRNVTTPKAKIIERIGGIKHRLLNHLPSYCGPDEQHRRLERIQKFLQGLKRVGQPRKAEVDPREKLLSKEEFRNVLTRALKDFASEPQNGERMPGISPAEAWKELLPKHPRRLLPDSLAYLISTERSEQSVTHEGVRVKRIGGGWNWYYGSGQLAALRGEKVEVFFNPDIPEHVTVIHRRSDADGVQPFSVPLAPRSEANTSAPERFAQITGQRRAFAGFAASTWQIIRPPTNLTVRNERLGTPAMRERGERINALDREQVELTDSRKRHGRRLAELAKREGIAVAANPRRPERALAAAERAVQLEKEIEAEGLG